MKKKNVLFLVIGSIMIICIIAVEYFRYPDITLNVNELSDSVSHRVMNICDEYYTITENKIIRLSDNAVIHKAENENIIVKAYDGHIWIYDVLEQNITCIDRDGKTQNTAVLNRIADDFMICDGYMYIAESDRISVLDISNDFSEIEYDMKPISSIGDAEIGSAVLGDTEIVVIDSKKESPYHDNSYCAVNTESGEYIENHGLYDFIHISSKELVVHSPYKVKNRLKIYNYSESIEKTISIEKFPVDMDFEKFNNNLNDIPILISQNIRYRTIGKMPPVETISNDMKFHKNDIISVPLNDMFSDLNTFKTKTFERILYSDPQKAITYYNGKYLTYSLEDRKVINKLSADEIEDGGSYTFETCGDYLFVFDDDTGELINRIEVDSDFSE